MDTLDGTDWDVVIAGTGVQESLLALALSRSGQKILHIDRQLYYGGAEAAFSLQEAEEWAAQVNNGRDSPSTFRNATIIRSTNAPLQPGSPVAGGLSFPRAYSLTLSPQIVYAESSLLSAIVSSQVEAQLEFLAIGSWWVDSGEDQSSSIGHNRLIRVPNGREDVFADATIDLPAKRALMKFLRFVSHFEDQYVSWADFENAPLHDFLSSKFNLPESVQRPLMALSLSTRSAAETTTSFALPRIARHLRSIGRLGPGFGAVIPKWGGLAEIAQVGCRAGAVGGAVYVLGNGITRLIANDDPATSGRAQDDNRTRAVRVQLSSGDSVFSKLVVGSPDNLPRETFVKPQRDSTTSLLRTVFILSSSLSSLFRTTSDESPRSAGTMVVFPRLSLSDNVGSQDTNVAPPPVHVLVHSSDTGACPAGQCVLYASVSEIGSTGHALIAKAVGVLLRSVGEDPLPSILWQLSYEQTDDHGGRCESPSVITFPFAPLDLAFDDGLLLRVKEVWEKILGSEANDFMEFPERAELGEADEQ